MMRIDRVLANNPGPFTGPGTNTWLVDDGGGSVAVIDPGPRDPRHLEAISERMGDRRPVAVLVTHTHPDHAPLANPLADSLGVPTAGHGPGPDFVPDMRLGDGEVIEIGSTVLEAIHTPGHSDDHICFQAGDALFTGDHLMGGSSVVVEKMGPYLSSLRKLRGRGLRRLHPGHGEVMENAEGVIEEYLAHRLRRHEQVLEAIRSGRRTVPGIVELVYADVDDSLHPLAAVSVTAHIGLLEEEGRIAFVGEDVVLAPPNAQ